MSDVPDSTSAPSAEELERTALPATLRRAPRFARVIGTGAVGGFVVGFLCGMILPNSTGVGRGTVGLVVGFGFACFAGLIAALVAVWLDRGSPAHLKQAQEREAAATAWASEEEGSTSASALQQNPTTDEERR